MTKRRVLVVDDEEDILRLVSYNFRRDGYDVTTALSGEDALEAARATSFDLILLDLMLPGIDGLDVCRAVRADAALAHVPIIMLTARDELADVVTGLELGADDYVTKPFSPRELLARVRAVLRREEGRGVGNAGRLVLQFNALVIEPQRHEVRVAGEPVDLTVTEFDILRFLAARPGWVFTRNQIIDAVRGDDHAVTPRAVDVQMVSLRRKLGEAARLIETVRGVGYRFRDSR